MIWPGSPRYCPSDICYSLLSLLDVHGLYYFNFVSIRKYWKFQRISITMQISMNQKLAHIVAVIICLRLTSHSPPSSCHTQTHKTIREISFKPNHDVMLIAWMKYISLRNTRLWRLGFLFLCYNLNQVAFCWWTKGIGSLQLLSPQPATYCALHTKA